MKVFIKVKRTVRAILHSIIFLLGGKGDIADEAVELGLCDYGGQK